MGDVVNLRRARKAKAKAQEQARAQANRARHGRSKAEKEATQKVTSLDDRRLRAHRREPTGSEPAE